MKRTLCLSPSSQLIFLAGLLSGASIAEAQLVQIGPGYVKAPFVRVYRTPNGTSVRAPFTHVESGTPFYGRQLRHQPSEDLYSDPQGDRFDNGDDTEVSLLERQRRLIGKSAWRLDHDLRRFRRASHWREVLQLPPEFLDADPIERNVKAVQPNQEAVKATLKNFDAVSGNARHRRIAQLQSFRTTHRLLRQYVSLLSLPSREPLPSEPKAVAPLLLTPPTVEQPSEELTLPLPVVPQ